MIGLLILVAAPIELRDTFGIGNDACEAAFASGRKVERETWIMGYWSGLNSAGLHNVRISQNADDMIAAVRIECTDHPDELLAYAISAVHSHHSKR